MFCDIFQSKEWEEFKLKTGYRKSYRVDDILILQKELPLNRTMLYSPMLSEKQFSAFSFQLSKLIHEIKAIAKQNNSIFYRLELNISQTADRKLPTAKFIKSFEEMQPENNWLIDLTKSEDEILAEMKQKGRYNIKIAQKNDLKITSSNKPGKELDAFYEEYCQTGSRHKISYRNYKYFKTMLEILGKKDYAKAYVVWKNDIPLASALIIFYQKEALYLYGGSSEKYRNLMAPYLLHWEIIKEAKEHKYLEYNFLGIAPNDDQNHPWIGITRFKKQFGGKQEDILGCFDLPIKPLEYQLFKIAEKIRRRN